MTHTGKQKITKNQRNQLIQIYLHMGVVEAQAMCREYGVHYRYAEKQAFELGRGIRVKRRNSAAPKMHKTRRSNDPRWERAKAIGPVIA